MDLSSAVISVFMLCVSVRLPTVQLRSVPSYDECGRQGGECVSADHCHALYSTGYCQADNVCCWTGEVEDSATSQHKVRNDNSRRSQTLKALFLNPVPEPSAPYVLSQKMEYTVDQSSEGSNVDTRIINVELLNNTLDSPLVSYTQITDGDRINEDGDIVFPEKSEENPDDHIKHIKKLYQTYAIEFKMYNTKKENEEEPPKRKSKYAVGFRSAKYCKLYESFSLDEALMAIPLLPSPFPVLMQNNHCSKPLPLIVGGTNASKGEFPHMAALGYDRGEWIDFLCGGSLISERYVLTAAHCGNTKWGPPIIVRLGTLNLITDVGQNLDVEHVIIHPDYMEPSSYHDIALIKVAAGLKMGISLRPACLPAIVSPTADPGSYLTATGWGRTGYGLFSSPNLQKVSLEVMDNSTCSEKFLGGRRMERLPEGIQSTLLCAAGYLDTSHDTCQGDSGGPLQTVTRHSKCMYEIVGITSFGKLCGTGLPAIYTRVSSYVAWIEDIVWPS